MPWWGWAALWIGSLLIIIAFFKGCKQLRGGDDEESFRYIRYAVSADRLGGVLVVVQGSNNLKDGYVLAVERATSDIVPGTTIRFVTLPGHPAVGDKGPRGGKTRQGVRGRKAQRKAVDGWKTKPSGASKFYCGNHKKKAPPIIRIPREPKTI